METYTFGDINADMVLLQAVDDHDLEGLDNEVKLIGEMTDSPFCLRALRVDNWNNDLSPWKAPAVFGDEDFGGGADIFLKKFIRLVDDGDMEAAGPVSQNNHPDGRIDDGDMEAKSPVSPDNPPENRIFIVGGYSLAGLFALWAAFETDRFAGVAAASPSVWFPGFTDYVKGKELRAESVYLSLGDKEAKTRNPVMSKVADNIRDIHEILIQKGVDCTLEWNSGNHFKDPDVRTAKAFSNVINRCRAR
jgi:hypothetical protein